jgi:hypothetical protein
MQQFRANFRWTLHQNRKKVYSGSGRYEVPTNLQKKEGKFDLQSDLYTH